MFMDGQIDKDKIERYVYGQTDRQINIRQKDMFMDRQMDR